ncbi:MAG TPA: PAS domain S-box protein [Bacteroidota bacterium]|nr:PAS domain S-box protein [Bacteroidota bacterium]
MVAFFMMDAPFTSEPPVLTPAQSAEESERRYRALVELSPDAIVVHFNGVIVYVNEAALRLVCAPDRESVIGRPFLDFVPEEFRHAVVERTERTLETPERQVLGIRSRTLNGQELYIEGMSVPIPYQGSYAHQVVLRDVTEQRRAERELFRLNRALKAIIAVSQTLARATREQQFLEDVCRILCDTGGYRLAWVGMPEADPDGRQKIIHPVVWMGEENGYLRSHLISWDLSKQKNLGPGGMAAATGRTTVMRGIQHPPDPLNDEPELWRLEAIKRGFASVIGVPLLHNQSVFGVLVLYSRQDDAFDKEEVKLLEQLAADIAFGISTLRDREEHRRAESALGETEDRYRLLVEHSPEAIVVYCDWILEYVNPAAVRLLGKTSADELLGKHFLDFVPEEFRDAIKVRSTEIECENEGHGGLTLTYVTESGEKLYYESVGARTTYNGKPARQIVIRDITGHKHVEADLERSREELRELAAHLQSAREEERTSIAREIHDELGQDLTGLKMDLALLEDLVIEHVKAPELNEMTDRIQSMSDLLNQTVHSVRKIISELRPVLLDKLGLSAAIEWQAEEFQSRTGIVCECYLTADDTSFPRDCATAVYRIFQESLTNVLRHAEATRVTVSFGRDESGFELEVRDNGVGIDRDAPSKTKSFGLIGMRERAHMFSGSVEILGTPGKGTTVRLVIPDSGLSSYNQKTQHAQSIST